MENDKITSTVLRKATSFFEMLDIWIHTLAYRFFKIYFNIILPPKHLKIDLLSSGFRLHFVRIYLSQDSHMPNSCSLISSS
jgi:hypothetical protein